jgi:hypothetical protein
MYLMVYTIKVGGPSTGVNYDISIRPNNLTTNQVSFFNVASSAGIGRGYYSPILLSRNAKGTTLFGMVEIAAQTSAQRIFSIRYTATTAVTGTAFGHWNETSTNLTSLVITSGTSSTLDVGSEFHLYKYATA